MNSEDHAQSIYDRDDIAPCPFTHIEVEELDENREMLVYLPAKLTPAQLCSHFEIPSNIDFANERMIRTVMINEDQWFVTSKSTTPELMYRSGIAARRAYEDDGLHGMDLRRYIAFAGTFKQLYGRFPDESYWTFLLSGSYDRSGISVVGFDRYGVLNHHGWMKNFKAKFVGSRYVVIAPRIERSPETDLLPRAYRGRGFRQGLEADMDS